MPDQSRRSRATPSQAIAARRRLTSMTLRERQVSPLMKRPTQTCRASRRVLQPGSHPTPALSLSDVVSRRFPVQLPQAPRPGQHGPDAARHRLLFFDCLDRILRRHAKVLTTASGCHHLHLAGAL